MGEPICPILESYQNSHGAAPVVWNFISQRFCNADRYCLVDEKILFKTAYREDIPEPFRKVMLMMYDRAVILNQHVGQAIQDIHTFLI